AYGHLPHVDVRQRRETAVIADRDHRHRAVAPARDDPATLERIEREIDVLPAAADDRAGGESAGVVERAEYDATADGQDVERRAHPRRRGFLRGVLVVAAEPARRDEGSPLGRPQVLLALARLLLLGRVLRVLAHCITVRDCSAASRTRSATVRAALSAFSFSITGTPTRRARATTSSCRRRMSSKRSM